MGVAAGISSLTREVCMALQSMISDIGWVAPKTVIEVARRAAGMSQRRLAAIARTQQSSVSEYELRRKSPTLDVVERLIDAANARLAVKPMVFFELHDDEEIGRFFVPDRLWSVPLPDCFAKVQILRYIFETHDDQVWDLSDEAQRIAYYELALVRAPAQILEDSVDGLLLIQAWPKLDLPQAIREAWQPLIDAATASQDRPPRDPGGISARIAGEIGLAWPPRRERKRNRA
ncbi:helix-turn-helix domain-containing protein [Nocardioides sp. GXZ039]|uniref:helix-turn-helix domain-containing protein n=1 Tax=Nocardioides sp. GXZ039 TaxID=3136018 RepID=UPI0030F3DAB7